MSKNKKSSQEKRKKNLPSSKIYQPKEVVAQSVEPIAPQRVRVLESSESEDEAPDFDYLLSLPASTGSHFLLKSEQQRFNQDSELEFSKHFHLDTSLLNLAIKSIPFNERHEIIDVQWNSTELQEMEKYASDHEKIYREALVRSQQEKEEASAIVRKMSEVKIQQNIKVSSNNPESSKSKLTNFTDPKKEKESMQEWLDDILDV